MLLFSTVLSINNSMTKEDFVRLVIEWNQGSPHKENIISGLEWNGEENIRYGSDELWLAIEEYQSKNIIAIRYEKKEKDGVIWDTDYVMDFNEMKMAIRLDRSYLESALTIDASFSTPHFISLLIRRGYLSDDSGLPVLNTPTIIDNDNVDILVDIINGKSKYQLPIVYISKTYYGEDPVDIKIISNRLKGVAHVLVQKGGWLNTRLREACDDQNEYSGAIGIYYPNQVIGHRRYLYRAYEGSDNILMEKVVRGVIQYGNSQRIDVLHTWQGVNNAILREQYSNQKKERLAAEYEKAKAFDEADALIESVDEEIRKLRQQVEELSKANDILTYENQGLRIKLDSLGDIPILFLGDEEEFYQGEIREMVLDAIDEKLRSTAEKTRRYDVLCDVIQKNGYEHIGEKRANSIKALFRDYKTMTGTLRQELIDKGFSIKDDGKHHRLTYYGDERYKTTVAKSGSDYREGKNIAATIIKNMM